jgi:hypothetical protein
VEDAGKCREPALQPRFLAAMQQLMPHVQVLRGQGLPAVLGKPSC